MNTRINPAGISYNNYKSAPTFKSNGRFYRLKNGEPMETFTYFFREDLPWKKFIPFIKEHFTNLPKVRLINAACSDGTEAFSLIIALKELLKGENYEKFLPIQAYDIDDEVLRAANSGYVLVNPDDVFEIKRYTKKMDKYLEKDNKEMLYISQNGMLNLFKGNSLLAQSTYKVDKRLSKQVNFNNADIFNILQNYEDNGDTILFFRNTLGHFKDDKRKDFIDLASTKLKSGSLLVIGTFDTNNSLSLKRNLYKAGFTRVMDNVYKKESDFNIFTRKMKNTICEATGFIVKLLFNEECADNAF